MSDRHYLDHASTSPLRPQAREAMAAWLQSGPEADPGRPYIEGRDTSAVIEDAREAVAAMFGVRPRRVIFTASGTEAANWVNVSARSKLGTEQPIVCAGVEHSAVRLSAERSGPTVALHVDGRGRINLDHLDEILTGPGPLPALVHCQFGNHEVGTLQPVVQVVEQCNAHNVAVHVDACAAGGQVPLDLETLNATYVSLSAHKFGGPKGIGAVVLGTSRAMTRMTPLFVGGDQERARRAGMENVLGIVGFGAVVKALGDPTTLNDFGARSRQLTETVIDATLKLDGAHFYGDRINRLPHIACFGIDGVEAEGVVLGLDQAGIAVHSGSACSSEDFEPSPVLQAMGVDADHSLRCSVGWSTTDKDIERFNQALRDVVSSLRALQTGDANATATNR